MTDDDARTEHVKRYRAAQLAVREAIALHADYERDDTDPVALRRDLTSLAIEHAALLRLVATHGVIDPTEYAITLADFMEAELDRQNRWWGGRFGTTEKGTPS